MIVHDPRLTLDANGEISAIQGCNHAGGMTISRIMGDNQLNATSLDKALRLMTAVVQDNGKHSLSVIAEDIDIPLATAHRAVLTLQRAGYLIRSRRGYYHPGPALTVLAEQANRVSVAVGVARPILAQLAAREECLAHLGVFEEDMVTYLLKEGADKDALFTRKDMQLEAYCSGLGKVLLAALDETALNAYLAGGPFVPLTRNTIVDPQALRAEIAKVRKQGFAIDDCEIRENLFCMAAPLSDNTGHVFAAISLSFSSSKILRSGWKMHLSKLRKATATISKRMQHTTIDRPPGFPRQGRSPRQRPLRGWPL